MKSDGISSCVLTMTAERCGDSIASGSLPAATIKSAPSKRSTCPAGIRMPCKLRGSAAMRTCDSTPPVLLREPRLIELVNGFAFEMRREAKQPARRDDSRAADAGDQCVVHAVELGLPRLGKLGSAAAASGRGGLRFVPRNVTKLGQNPLKQLKS
jgi:hypothetical protein